MESDAEREVPRSADQPTGKWYFVITVATGGLLAAVPFFHAASALRRPSLRKVGAGYAVAALFGFVLMGLAPEDEYGDPTGWLGDMAVAVLVAVVLGATLQQIALRQQVYGRRESSVVGVPNLTAIGLVEEARLKRQEARALAQRDPLMARELRIGRPDLPRRYDDGGLVDLNTAPAETIAELCQISLATAQRLVSTRIDLGGFGSVEEAVVYGNVSVDSASGMRERGIVIAPMGVVE